MAINDKRFKSSEVRKLVESGKYKMAFTVVDKINMDKVKNCNDFNVFADVYIKAGQYDKAYDMLMRVYREFPGRRVIYRLVLVSIKKGDLDKAEEFYREYAKKYQENMDRWILRYRLDKVKKENYSVRIRSLEKLKQDEYIEEWAYELAKMYHKAGMAEKCISECNDIILWFGEGVLVEKARLLRDYYLEGRDILAETEPEKLEQPEENLLMNTVDLGKQIAEIEKLEKDNMLRRELAEELQPTANIQSAMMKDLGLTDDLQVRAAINRIIEEQEQAQNKKAVLKKKHMEMETESKVVPINKKRQKKRRDGGLPDEEEQGGSPSYEEEQGGSLQYEEEQGGSPLYEEEQGGSPLYEEEQGGSPLYEEEQTCERTSPYYGEEEIGNLPYEENLSQENSYAGSQDAEENKEEPSLFFPAEEEAFVPQQEKEYIEINFEEVFGRFAREEAVGEQLHMVMNRLAEESGGKNFIITGEERETVMLLAKRLAKALHLLGYVKSPRVAKIRGRNLNGMDLKGNWERLKNSTLFIEGSAELYTPSVKGIEAMIQNIGNEMIVILADEADAMEIMLQENFELKDYFKYTIVL